MNFMRLIRFYDRLSTRLLTLTALWVTFVIFTLGYLMYLSQSVQSAGNYQYEVGSLPVRVYRLNLFSVRDYRGDQFASMYRAVNESINQIETRGEGAVLFVNRTQEVEAVEQLVKDWRQDMGPAFLEARQRSEMIDNDKLERFILEIDRVNQQIAVTRDKAIYIQTAVQTLLMILAVGSLFGIMFFLTRWVIRPTEYVRSGLSELREGKLDTRLCLKGATEFEAIASDFNAMADRLQDLVENLAGKVREKTEAVEEKNRNLSHLYELTSFVTQQHSVDEMCEGFASRMMQYTEADSSAVFLIDRKRKLVELAASMELPQRIFTWFSLNPMPLESVEDSLRGDVPLRISSGTPEDFLPSLRAVDEGLYRTAYVFHVRSGAKDLGFFVLYFKQDKQLLPQVYKLYESFGAHLGVAVDSIRMIEREQQYAVVQERNLMAQGLHDSIAQSLSFLNLQVQLLQSGLDTGDKALVDTTVAQIKAGVQESYEDVRELLLNFRERVHTESFSEAIATVIDRFESQTKIPVHLTVTGPEAALTDREKIQVIFIMQEALANVRKHSKATEVVINIDNGACFKLEVIDNGCGIDEVMLLKRSKRHVGMNIMKERAGRIGAKVSVGAVPAGTFPSGTCVELIIDSEGAGEGAVLTLQGRPA